MVVGVADNEGPIGWLYGVIGVNNCHYIIIITYIMHYTLHDKTLIKSDNQTREFDS